MNTQIWAHRGASGYAPENTLPAFELAEKQGADGIELDVQLTKDGEVVVIHDEKIDRVCAKKGLVKDYTLQELKEFSFHNHMAEYAGVQIPTLREVYEQVKPTSLCVNVELKTGIFFYEGLEEKVLEIAHEYGMETRVWYSSFNHETLIRLKGLDSSVKTGMLYADGIVDAVNYAKKVGVDAMHPALYNLQYKGFLDSCKKENMPIHVWTVNEEADMERLVEQGIEAIITNYPDKACAVRGRTENK
ncbi:MAG: glycerophosphodiester phosphodiesterase [Lachnospiraceae bacterium]|nr:glycerophosphodiester phosphodiesterase [Lachnospiraceae bacterium]MDD3614789.1 glycerophosphodiester phosphodiesterase [Lachnospiraceae bacterium]